MSDNTERELRRELKIARMEATNNDRLLKASLAVCDELHKRIDGLERNNQILMRSACPERSWCAPDEPTEEMISAAMKWFAAWSYMSKATKESTLESAFISMRQAYLASRGKV
jgi:hypothetical protein